MKTLLLHLPNRCFLKFWIKIFKSIIVHVITVPIDYLSYDLSLWQKCMVDMIISLNVRCLYLSLSEKSCMIIG